MDQDDPYRLDEAISFTRSYVELASRTKAASLRGVAKAFDLNMERVVLLGAMPLHVASVAFRLSEFLTTAHHKLALKRGELQTASDYEAIWAEVYLQQEKLVQSKGEANLAEDNAGIGQLLVRKMIEWQHPAMGYAVSAVLSSMVLSSWTAFECLAVDLWVQAINECPTPLAGNVIDWKRSSSSTGAGKGNRNEEKSIELYILKAHKYNLQGVMGHVLKDSGKAGFDCFEAITISYDKAFKGATNSIFANHPSMPVIEAIRNLYSHRGGIVDSKFVTRVKNNPDFRSYKVNDLIRIDGRQASVLIDTLIKCSMDLLGFVDEWIVEHDGGKPDVGRVGQGPRGLA